jgi:hypothetical protein
VEPTSAATRCVRGWVRDALAAEAGLADAAVGVRIECADLAPADLVGALVRQRVVELVHSQAALDLPREIADGIAQISAAGRALVPLQLLELARLRDVLDAAGVRFLVFKGPALSVQTTGDLGARGFGDLDVLVDPRSVEEVTTELLAHGWTTAEPLPPPGSWAWKRILHTGHELTFLGSSCSVDLHWRLDPTLDALPGFAELWSRRETADLGSGAAPILGPADALSHACLNAAKDEWRWLRNLVDVHRLARLDEAWDSFTPGRVQLHALAVTQAQLGLPSATPAEVRDRVDRLRPRTTARLVAAANRAQERPVRTLLEAPGSATTQFLRYQLAASSSPRDVRRAFGALVLPGRSVSRVDATTPWVGVPVGLGRRVGVLARQSVGRHVSEHVSAYFSGRRAS